MPDPANCKPPDKSWMSPTYPQRVHIREKPELQRLLAQWEGRISQAAAQLVQNDTSRRRLLYAQMCGARDQIAEAVSRMPTEVGDLYDEDKHRLEQAIAALERTFARWPSN